MEATKKKEVMNENAVEKINMKDEMKKMQCQMISFQNEMKKKCEDVVSEMKQDMNIEIGQIKTE